MTIPSDSRLLGRKIDGGNVRLIYVAGGEVLDVQTASGDIVDVQLVNGAGAALLLETINNTPVTMDIAAWSSLQGNSVCRWVEDKTGVNAAPTVLTDGPAAGQPGIYYNLSEGDIVMVTTFCMELTTQSDQVAYSIGYTDAANGAGTYTQMSPTRVLNTGASASGFQGTTTEIIPPGRVRYADGARSITYRVQTNDANAAITPAWHAYVIKS